MVNREAPDANRFKLSISISKSALILTGCLQVVWYKLRASPSCLRRTIENGRGARITSMFAVDVRTMQDERLWVSISVSKKSTTGNFTMFYPPLTLHRINGVTAGIVSFSFLHAGY